MATIGSLFSGIGGLELGLEWAGLGPVIWQAEIDSYCLQVLEHYWPEAIRYNDVRLVDEKAERPTILCGGFPCTDVSLAGKGLGLAGPESGLWREYFRVVRCLRPPIVVVENVAALRRRGLSEVLGDLASLGYDAWWDCVPAAAVRAPHRRDRLFVVAWRVPDSERDGVRDEPERGAGPSRAGNGRHAQPDDLGADVADANHNGLADLPDGSERRGRAWAWSPLASRRDPGDVADADVRGREGERVACGQPGNGSSSGHVVDGRSSAHEDVARAGRRAGWRRGIGEPQLGGTGLPLWPPGPDDMHAWGSVPARAQPAFCRLADGVLPSVLGPNRGSSRGPALRALGNAVVPQVGEVIGHVVLAILAHIG